MDEAYERGYVDYIAGVGIYQNPFPENTVEFRRWVDGRVRAIIEERLADEVGGSNKDFRKSP